MTLKIESYTVETGQIHEHVFGSQVRAAGVALTQYKIGYGLPESDGQGSSSAEPALPEEDHHVKDISAGASIVSVSNEKVTVKGEGEIRDDSGNTGGGTITYTLFVDVE